jgi:methylated-DNA-protein-cysteine methyltransferase-like protein
VKKKTSLSRRRRKNPQPALSEPEFFRRSVPDQSSKMRIRIEAAIREIPKGKVSTYGAIARAAGYPGRARLAAQVLHRGFGLPWQRVLGAGGEIKLRGESAMEQRLRLEAEGVRFRGRRVDMKACEFKFAGKRAVKNR